MPIDFDYSEGEALVQEELEAWLERYKTRLRRICAELRFRWETWQLAEASALVFLQGQGLIDLVADLGDSMQRVRCIFVSFQGLSDVSSEREHFEFTPGSFCRM